jgi:hypothetical protein
VLRRIGRIRSFDVSARISRCHSGKGTWAFSSNGFAASLFAAIVANFNKAMKQYLLELLKEVG